MVQLLVRVTSPSGQESEVRRGFESARLPAQLARDCVRTQLGVDSQDGDVFTYIEEWENPPSFERRLASAEFASVLRLMEVSVEAPVLECRFVSETRGLEFVTAVRTGAHENDGGRPRTT